MKTDIVAHCGRWIWDRADIVRRGGRVNTWINQFHQTISQHLTLKSLLLSYNACISCSISLTFSQVFFQTNWTYLNKPIPSDTSCGCKQILTEQLINSVNIYLQKKIWVCRKCLNICFLAVTWKLTLVWEEFSQWRREENSVLLFFPLLNSSDQRISDAKYWKVTMLQRKYLKIGFLQKK